MFQMYTVIQLDRFYEKIENATKKGKGKKENTKERDMNFICLGKIKKNIAQKDFFL